MAVGRADLATPTGPLSPPPREERGQATDFRRARKSIASPRSAPPLRSRRASGVFSEFPRSRLAAGGQAFASFGLPASGGLRLTPLRMTRGRRGLRMTRGRRGARGKLTAHP
jgi:hypothetical protein